MTIKVSKPWSGKKDSLPDPNKKELHQTRKTKKAVVHDIEDTDWEQQLKEYYASQSIQE